VQFTYKGKEGYRSYLWNDNTTDASVFISKLGNIGKLVFGFMIWAASITSVMGATYTSLSFIKS
jgi:Mn2+/Fe2+ NRAMP family transporter